jgi:putative ABC transport system permease protein
VAVLPPAMLKGSEMVQMALRPAGFAPGEYLSTRYRVERDVQATTDSIASSAANDSAQAIVAELVRRVASEPGVVGVSVASSEPWSGGHSTVQVDGADRPAERTRVITVDTSFFGLFGVQVLAGRGFAASDATFGEIERPVIVNRSFVDEVIGGGDPIGRRVRYPSVGDGVNPWHTVVGVVDDFPAGFKVPGGRSVGTLYHLAMPGEWASAMLTVRLRGQTPETFAPSLRRAATSIDPLLQLTSTNALHAIYQEYTLAAGRLALVVALITGSVLLLSAAGIHALMSFTVNQRRREIGIRSALGASARRILTSVLARAVRQLSLGVGIGLTMAIGLDVVVGGELMGGSGLLLVPGTAVFMLVVGVLAALGPARRGLDVQPTEALRAE